MEKLSPVVITGASTGIGAACALHLAEHGFQVYAGVRKIADGEALAARAQGQIVPLLLDVTNPLQVSEAAARVESELGGRALHGLINNAGIVVAGPLEYLPVGEIRRLFEVNVFGLVAVTQSFLPLLRRGPGRIVHIGSISGVIATPFVGPYAASKFALEALSDSWRMELKASGIEMSLIQPGAISTPIWDKSRDHSEAIAAALPECAHAQYGHAFERLRANVEQVSKVASPPAWVAQAVHHALTARRPKTRYKVGRGATLQYLLSRLLPDRLLDAAILKITGIH